MKWGWREEGGLPSQVREGCEAGKGEEGERKQGKPLFNPRRTTDRDRPSERCQSAKYIEVGSASFSPSLHSPAALDGNGGDGFVHEAQIGLDGAINCRDGRGEFGCTLAEWHRV